MTLNGFEIDRFNQYNLPEGVRYSTCPSCSEHRRNPANRRQKCMMLDWDRGLGTCQHCGEIVQLHTYKKKTDEMPHQKKIYIKPKWKNNTNLSEKLVKWFEGRGISQRTLKAMKISEGPEWMPQTQQQENTVQFNYFRDGELINIKYRDGRKNFKLHKDSEKILYNLDCCKASPDIVIVEGEMDVLSFVEAGIMQVVSIPNGSTQGNANLDYIDNCIGYFENKDKIYLALDDDAPGLNTAKELIRRLGSYRCFLVTSDWKEKFGVKDANEYLLKFGKEKLSGSLEDSRPVPLEGVSSVLDWESKYDEYLINGMRGGYKTGKFEFDKIFSTYTGQYIVVTGIPSSGKSDWVDEMCIGYNRMYQWKTAFASPENKPNVIHASKLEAKICGQWVNKKSQVESAWHQHAKQYINENFKFIDLPAYDLDSVLEKAEDMVFRFGIKCLVIDPYNKVRLKGSAGKNITEQTNDYLIKIDEFARKHDILVILVAHPRKPDLSDAKSYEPSFYDIKGGGEFYDMSPHGLLVHRDYVNNAVKVKVLKVKFSHLGSNNAFCWYKWNPLSGRYSEYGIQNKDATLCRSLREDNENWLQVHPEEENAPSPVPFNESFFQQDTGDDMPF